MINLLVPPEKSGGVYDFSRKLQSAIGEDQASLVHLSKHGVADWVVVPGDAFVLQFSGYGFDRRGVPLWLLHAIKNRRREIRQLGVFFHELYAFGPPWTSSFWLSPLQRNIAKELIGLSDFWMTSREGSAVWLRRYGREHRSVVLPVFSNVGELASLPNSRMPWLVVFGSRELRRQAYRNAGEKLFAWAKREGLQVHDIGAPLADTELLKLLLANGVIQHGLLDEQEAHDVLSCAMFGLVSYPERFVAKSGVFAAYCAHGACPILLSDTHVATDGLVAGKHYLPGIPTRCNASLVASEVGGEAWSWYQGHCLEKHASKLCEMVRFSGETKG